MSHARPSPDSLLLPLNQWDDFTVLTPYVDYVHNRLDPKARGSQTLDLGGKEARVQPALCYCGRAISITVRPGYRFKKFRLSKPAPADYHLESGYQPAQSFRNDILNSVDEVCRTVFAAIRMNDPARSTSGLLVISGSTKSLKTKLALGLIHIYLEDLMRQWWRNPKKRRPHLITCEDDTEAYFTELEWLSPIEQAYVTPGGKNKPIWLSDVAMPDYTPRCIPKDVKSLALAVDDALRMTPAAFYAGEIRKREDWDSLYRLAQSHLVVLTTHASSLVNTFSILQDRLHVRTKAQQSDMASSLRAVVHLRGSFLPLDGSRRTKGLNYVVPACWINTPLSVAEFTGSGLASLQPGYFHVDDTSCLGDSDYCLGRRGFMDELLRLTRRQPDASKQVPDWEPLKPADRRKILGEPSKTNVWAAKKRVRKKCKLGRRLPVNEKLRRSLRRQATAWDLRGE
jgi:hypothetical protein